VKKKMVFSKHFILPISWGRTEVGVLNPPPLFQRGNERGILNSSPSPYPLPQGEGILNPRKRRITD